MARIKLFSIIYRNEAERSLLREKNNMVRVKIGRQSISQELLYQN